MEQVEELMKIEINIDSMVSLDSSIGDSVVMISFTGQATGKFFQGEVQPGGVDTQIISQDKKKHTLSARYIIKGKDYLGQDCTLYIENNGNIHEPNEAYIFRTYPNIISSNESLQFLEQDILVAEGRASENGVTIYIYRVK